MVSSKEGTRSPGLRVTKPVGSNEVAMLANKSVPTHCDLHSKSWGSGHLIQRGESGAV